MKFGHLENGKLIKANLPITVDGRDYFTNDPQILLTLGEKEIVTSNPPSSEKGVYTEKWVETDTQLIQEWEFVAHDDQELEKNYKRLVNTFVREKYSASREFGILRDYMAYGDACKADFDEYNTYVESCKEKAHTQVYN